MGKTAVVGAGPMADLGWKRYVGTQDWFCVVLDGFPGWELNPATREPYRADLSVTKGRDRHSRDIAVEFDEIATGPFYWRDWTDDGLPFVSDGETYRSAFWFARRADFDVFVKKYGATV
jgi:hypothetical protein